MTMAPASLPWFARHELTLAWREWHAMMTGGRRARGIGLAIFLVIVMLLLHLLAFGLVAPWVKTAIVLDKGTLVLVTGTGLLFWTVMLSQALESITRVYYARSDLDLILSSPASSQRLFTIRTAAVALTTMALTGMLASPLINMLAILDGAHWLAAYAVVAALGALATAISLAITMALFQFVGPKRTRLIAQIVAAVVGAGFVIGVQAAAIIYYGNMSRFTLLQSAELIAAAPAADSPFWLPAHALLGDPLSLTTLLAVGVGALIMMIVLTASSYGHHAISAAGLSHIRSQRRPSRRSFKPATTRQTLRRKEWRLLQRAPWLLSQTLMQILYLVPPALLLWMNFGNSAGAFVVVVPVLVMASGQLAGGLAWLAISGEDAHDLVVTAPVTPGTVLIAKIEAVLIVIALVLAPLLLLLAFASPRMALIAAICAMLSAGSATAIQLWFRVVAKRSMFRRRQVASRAATLSEAFASIMWAATGALLAAGSWLALGPAFIAVLVLCLAKLISPKRR
ncbi:permease [Devosia neptuniae]|jgi:ABC-2 type transport system permease protein|uniref:permease n=1 Tax=Devosia TaxID=46913 RepID=UPI0022AEDB62|nr:permease [Devosia neptuniae]MCZ4347114.1 permease [Devosia neptuniae]|tara:strand:+ start:9270 stop:10802 length:1533 start_codon:yes stop_codon:yes gene_type:complete